MRILTVSHFFESHGGGIERVAGHLCREFSGMGHVASWAASNADAAPCDAGLNNPDAAPCDAGHLHPHIVPVPLNCYDPLEKISGLPMPLPSFPALLLLRREIRQADAVLVHDALYVTSIAAMIMAKWSKKPVLIIQHIAAIPFRNAFMRAIMRAANFMVTAPMLRGADHVVYISDTTRQAFAHIATKKSPSTLFNGVNSIIFHENARFDPPIRANMNMATGRKAMLFVGRFVEKKGLHIIEKLAKMRPDIDFILVGGGPIDPAAWALSNVYLAGTKTAPELAALYRAADALILPSVGEGYPLVIQEAMACGLPVICGEESAQADPQAAQWLHGVNINIADPDAAAVECSDQFDVLTAVPNNRAEMSKWAREHYSWRAMAAAIMQLLTPPPKLSADHAS